MRNRSRIKYSDSDSFRKPPTPQPWFPAQAHARLISSLHKHTRLISSLHKHTHDSLAPCTSTHTTHQLPAQAHARLISSLHKHTHDSSAPCTSTRTTHQLPAQAYTRLISSLHKHTHDSLAPCTSTHTTHQLPAQAHARLISVTAATHVATHRNVKNSSQARGRLCKLFSVGRVLEFLHVRFQDIKTPIQATLLEVGERHCFAGISEQCVIVQFVGCFKSFL